jgi:quinolinate synthase
MKMTSLSDLLAALKGEGGKEVEIDETVRLSAKATIDKMLSYGG